ncbi:MAG: hypothetical protein M0014_10045 [Actinomycetota bacterium]|jgi:hypothetical protein|nr:hypothetical protein [Actinomycetota bacterium]
MAEPTAAAHRRYRYRFARPGNVELSTGEYESDEAAEAAARRVSSDQQTPVIVERHDLVDWEYVTEVDER